MTVLTVRPASRPQLIDERKAVPLVSRQSFSCSETIDVTLDVEQRIDPLYRLERRRRDRCGVLSTFCVRGYAGKHEKLPTRVCPAESLDQRPRLTIRLEQRVVAAIGVSLQNAGEGLEMARSGCSCRRSREE